MNTLMIMGVNALLPSPTHHAYICSSGSSGYHAFREMLEVGGRDQKGCSGDPSPDYPSGNNPSILLITNIDMGKEVSSSVVVVGNEEGGSGIRGGSNDEVLLLGEYDDEISTHNFTKGGGKGVDNEAGMVLAQILPVSRIHSTLATRAAGSSSSPYYQSGSITTTKQPHHHQHLTTFGKVHPLTGDAFLMEYSSTVRTIDLQAFNHVVAVGSSFLMSCSSLTTISLTPFRNVTSVGQSFLDGCTGLLELDLTPLENVRIIAPLFLAGCVGLSCIDLTPLSSVVTIGSWFLSDCSGLESINLTGLSNLRTLFSSFLFRCSKLESIDLTPLQNLESVGISFISECTNLKTIKLENNNVVLQEVVRRRHPDKFHDGDM